ncbi:hypothetical protein ACJMK2_040311 [Sinanodonta woodiana]|uniref:Uncharacterized protein n=1 Tax=Sinanodonta woodiana TaxID=1069815 RepID=A0ABD3WG81_SINWO
MASLISYMFHTVSGDNANDDSASEKARIWGPITRNLWKVFKKYKDAQDHVPLQKLRLACNELGLLPSKCQVYEMVQCAVEYGSPCKPDHITFGEFCVLISELQNYYLLSPVSPRPRSHFKERIETFGGKKKRRVFLGGSCNPTTWRADKAIPFFKDHEITFYNPQVQSWIPELMELEAQAKQMADVLFFVVDTETRAVASMIETAYLIACKRQVVMVIPEYQKPSVMISEEKISDSELSDLERARLILTDLAERNSVPVFTSLDPALEGTKIILSKGIRVQDLTLKDGAQPVRYGFLKLGEALLQLREAFNSVDNTKRDKLSAKDICLAYKCCTGEDLDTDWLKRKQKLTDDYLFEEFCCIVTENRENVHHDNFIEKLVSNVMSGPLRWIFKKIFSQPPPPCLLEVENIEDVRDVYLGGTCGGSRWREDIAEPLFRKQGLSYINPCGNGWSRKLIPILVASREKCRMFLYIITNETRSVASMIEAGYYIGLGCKLILCVQKLQKDRLLGGEQMTENGIKDYNRGRDYLCDLANREGVPLFEDVMEAVNCVITSLSHGHANTCQEPSHF